VEEVGAEATRHATHSSKVTAREAVTVASHTMDQEEEEAWGEGLVTTVLVSFQMIGYYITRQLNVVHSSG
jgi:hypothetical protein